jgi:hypothetical protein
MAPERRANFDPNGNELVIRVTSHMSLAFILEGDDFYYYMNIRKKKHMTSFLKFFFGFHGNHRYA